MSSAPTRIGNATVLRWASTAAIEKTDACTFTRAGEVQTTFAGLAIAQYENDSGFYLFLCDENWQTLNDLYHESIAEAESAAERLYPGISARWLPPVE